MLKKACSTILACGALLALPAQAQVHSHDGSVHSHGTSITTLSNTAASINPTSGPIRFAVMGDIEVGNEDGNGANTAAIVNAVNAMNPDFVVFPGDLISDGGQAEWQLWEQRTSVFGNNRYMVPGNHDRGPGGTVTNWQNTFNWLPNSQVLNGKQGIDRMDYYVDHGNVRIVSVATDIPGVTAGGQPQALDWFREVMKDVDARNNDADPNNNIDHVIPFTHHPVTVDSGSSGGTAGDWWNVITGQDGAGTDAQATALIAGHWHYYQNNRPDAHADTTELISSGAEISWEGAPHRRAQGFHIITIDGGNVTAEYYGNTSLNSNGHSIAHSSFTLLDTTVLAEAGGLQRGERAFYEFNSGSTNQGNSASSLSKNHELVLGSGAIAFNDPVRGDVLDLTANEAFARTMAFGEADLALTGDLTIELSFKANGNILNDSVLLSNGRYLGSQSGGLHTSRESGNMTYLLRINPDHTLSLVWEHGNRIEETVTSTEAIDDPNQWNDIKVVRDADTMSIQFFVNGSPLGDVLVATHMASGGGTGSLFIGVRPDTNVTGEISDANLLNGVGTLGNFNGWIDSLRISDDAIVISAFDLTQDGVVDGLDWLAFAGQLGQANTSQGDFNNDDVVNHADFLLFKEAYNNVNGAASFEAMLTTIPEPASIVLVGMGGLLMLRRKAY